MPDLRWSLAFVVPNLNAPVSTGRKVGIEYALTLGQEGIAIVPASDTRVSEIRRQSSGADTLVGSFMGEHGEPHAPAVLIIREDVAQAIGRDVTAVVAFRNAVAMSFVLPGRVRFVAESGRPVVSWTDFFDFHPTGVALDDTLYTSTPAFHAFWIPEEDFQAMPSTGIQTDTDLGAPDLYLARNLGKLWRERFLSPRRDRLLGRLVFRSLEIAYHAASMTNRNEASLNDYGLQVALWVTALEVLARPARGSVSQHGVLSLLREYQWDDRRLAARRYTLRFRNRSGWNLERDAIVPKLCNNLYQARHRFVHGDRITTDALTPRVGGDRPALPRVAALIYRAALAARMMRRFKRRPWSFRSDIFPENLAGFEQEQALLRVMGLD
jgi:hypothetical protein